MHERRHEPCSNFLTGRSAQNSQTCWVFALYLLKKKAQIICASDSAAECTASDSLDPSSSPPIAEQLSFCWNGFCARDCFKHSEAKWRQLPWLLSETLFSLCRLLHLESCTPGQDWAKWYVLVRTSTYQYETVQGSTRIPYWYEAVCTGTYQYVLSNS